MQLLLPLAKDASAPLSPSDDRCLRRWWRKKKKRRVKELKNERRKEEKDCTLAKKQTNKKVSHSYALFLTSSLEMKFFASLEMISKLSSLKSYTAFVTLAIVSRSDSPMKGDRPERLFCERGVMNQNKKQNQNIKWSNSLTERRWSHRRPTWKQIDKNQCKDLQNKKWLNSLTCRWWSQSPQSWPPRGRQTPACRTSPAASPWRWRAGQSQSQSAWRDCPLGWRRGRSPAIKKNEKN